MASAIPPMLKTLPIRRPHNPPAASCPRRSAAVLTRRRREWLLALTATTVLTVSELQAAAQDIPLFGIRKKLQKAEEAAEQVLSEGIETAEKGIVAAEKKIVAAEKGIEAAEKGIASAERQIETAASFGGLAQAGAVAAAEVVGVLVATSIVNGILGPEAQKS